MQVVIDKNSSDVAGNILENILNSHYPINKLGYKNIENLDAFESVLREYIAEGLYNPSATCTISNCDMDYLSKVKEILDCYDPRVEVLNC